MNHPAIILITSDPSLERIGIEAVTDFRRILRVAHTTPEAIARITSRDDLELAIVDLSPNIEGIPLIEALAPFVPVIAVVDRNASYLRTMARERGAVAVLEKPLTSAPLLRAVEGALTQMVA